MAGRMGAAAVILTIAAVAPCPVRASAFVILVRPRGALLLSCLPRNARCKGGSDGAVCARARARVCVCCVQLWLLCVVLPL